MLIPTDKLVEMLRDDGSYSERGIRQYATLNDIDPLISGESWKIPYCLWAGIDIPQGKPRPQKKKPIKQSLRTKVFERDAYRCKFCDDWHGLTVDHIIPESKGGTLVMDNLQTLCKSCNSKKGNRIQ